MNRFSAAVILFLFVVVSAGAQDGLYAPVLPGDTAYVRVINARSDAEPLTLDVGPIRIGPVESRSGSPYFPVRPGVFLVQIEGSRGAVTAGPASFHSILVHNDGLMIAEDPHHDDALRSEVVLYNLSSGALRLDAVVPEAPLLGPVRPEEAARIAVNAIPVTLAVSRAGVDSTTGLFQTDLTLTRGDSYAIVVADPGLAGASQFPQSGSSDAPAGFVVRASLAADGP